MGKTSPYLTPCSPLAYARKGSQLKSPVFGNQGYPDVDPESQKHGQSSEGTWEAAGTELTPTPSACALTGIAVIFLGGKWLLKGAQPQRGLENGKCTASPSEQPIHFLSPSARKSHCISGLIFSYFNLQNLDIVTSLSAMSGFSTTNQTSFSCKII